MFTKLVVWMILACGFATTGCSFGGKKPLGETKQAEVVRQEPTPLDAAVVLPLLRKFRAELGMKYILDVLGEPKERLGKGMYTLIYPLTDGTSIRVLVQQNFDYNPGSADSEYGPLFKIRHGNQTIFDPSDAELTADDLSKFKPLSDGIRHASALILYEGLPNSTWAPEQFSKEFDTKKILRIHGFPFYERPLDVEANAVEQLRRLSAAENSYWTYGGRKLCGGFHPDYCLAWQDGGATFHLLICFGCHEMKLHGPNTELLIDIREEAIQSFGLALKPYRDQRP